MFINRTHEEAHETLKSGDIAKAIELYSKVLIEHPTNCDVLSDRGVAYLHANDKANSMKDLDRAIELQPDYAFRYACRAFAKNHFKDLDGAVADYQIAIKLDPDDAVAHNNLGLLLEQQGYQKEAQERFERADKLSKAEDGLFDVIDDIETKKSDEQPVVESNNVSTEQELSQSEPNGMNEFKKVFTSRKQFKEFISFVKNGFKLK